MPIISKFPGGSGTGGGVALSAVTNIATLEASGKVYIKWTDPEDVIVGDVTLAVWGGTLLVRKAGSMPISRRDGTIVLDNIVRNQYADAYFCDSGLTDGVTYYYKFFPYTNTGTYTDSINDEFDATPTTLVTGIEDWVVTGMSASTEAGDGKMEIKWTDPAAGITVDGVDLAEWGSTTVVVKEGGYPTGKDDEGAVYTLKSITRNQYASTPLVVSGLTNGTTYYIAFYPETTDGAVNVSESQRTTGVANRISIDAVPAQSGTLTYTGNPLTPAWSNYDEAQLTIGGTTSGTSAGSYTATFTPTTDYRWSDGSVDAKEVSWSIGKASGSLTLSKSSVTLNATTTSTTVTITRAGDGAITATSNKTSVATVSVSGNTLTIKSVNSTTGTATITVKVAEGSNHLAPSNKTISVTAQFLPAVGTSLNKCSWSDVSAVAAAGKGSNYFAVGDCKAVTVNGTVGTLSVNATYYVYIIGFNHNGSTNTIDFGTFKTAATSGKDVCLVTNYGTNSSDGTKNFNMNHSSNGSAGGWKGCDLRYDILGSTKTKGANAATNTATSPVSNTLMAALPSDLRAVMKPMTIYTDNTSGGSNTAANVTSTIDYLPLLAEFEIFGEITCANSAEKNHQKQYAYYSAGNSVQKYRHDSTSSRAFWRERSPGTGSSGYFCRVHTGNAPSYNPYASEAMVTASYGICPIFRV